MFCCSLLKVSDENVVPQQSERRGRRIMATVSSSYQHSSVCFPFYSICLKTGFFYAWSLTTVERFQSEPLLSSSFMQPFAEIKKKSKQNRTIFFFLFCFSSMRNKHNSSRPDARLETNGLIKESRRENGKKIRFKQKQSKKKKKKTRRFFNDGQSRKKKDITHRIKSYKR